MLTKRPQLISKLCPIIDHPRVWQGVTAENQHWLDIRWKHLREVQSIVKWLSVEPMMGPMRLPADFLGLGKCGWVICGGQSGRGAVHMDPNWARDLRDQCLSAGVPFHMKQMSGNTKAELEAIPEDLRIREYPEV
jgi:protein gp37